MRKHFSSSSLEAKTQVCIFPVSPVHACLVMSDFANPWTVASQAPLSMGFSRQEYWSGLPFPSPGDLQDPGIQPASPASAGGFFLPLNRGGSPVNIFF